MRAGRVKNNRILNEHSDFGPYPSPLSFVNKKQARLVGSHSLPVHA
jgi:hypothetical protein